jgi:primosomal protein N' (replication factor Y) (superfamily II helicase)
MDRVVRILIDGASSDLTFSYLVPEGVEVRRGQRVRVPLRNRRAVGTVVEIEEVDAASLPYPLKPIEAVVAEDAFLTPGLIELAGWISEFYLAPLETVVRTMLPKPSRGEVEKRKSEKTVELTRLLSPEDLEGFGKRSRKQRELLDHLMREGPDSLARLTGALGFSRSSVQSLEGKGFLKIFDQVVHRDPVKDVEYVESLPLVLNAEQAEVLARIEESERSISSGGKVRPILLCGVTGSGKTEVYLQAIQRTLEAGKGAIVLVPEISLTPQTADRFKQRFAKIQDQVAILHSSLGEGERHDEWRKVLDQRAKIVIGARSAIFSPMANLGLIVVDEEHENSYKQDTVPRYQARDIAVVRLTLKNAPSFSGAQRPRWNRGRTCSRENTSWQR